MITFNSISPSILLKLVLQALVLFILKIISIMAKLKLNFLNLIRDIPKTLYKVKLMNKIINKKTKTINSVIIISNKKVLTIKQFH